MRTPARAGASTTLIDSDDDSAGKVIRANRSFRVSHRRVISLPGHRVAMMEADIFLLLAPPSSEPCCYTCECYIVRMRAVRFTYLTNDRY